MSSRRNAERDPAEEELPGDGDSGEDAGGSYYYDDDTGYEIFHEEDDQNEPSTDDTASA